jgi:integrase
MLDWLDESGKRKRISLGHADRRKAETQRVQKEGELRMGIIDPSSMRLSQLWTDSQARTRGQLRQSSLMDADIAVRQLIAVIGDIDCQKVSHKHGEQFIQSGLDGGNALATVNKKVRTLKRVFELAVFRGFLEANPFRHLRGGRVSQQEIHIYTEDECHRLLRAARELDDPEGVNWELLIALALSTAMRRGELFNLVWRDIDFEQQIVKVSPKQDTDKTWVWFVKDAERRILPLTDDVLNIFLQHHEKQPEGSVYVLVPACRYEHIQQRRKEGKWNEQDGRIPINNFTRRFSRILERASIDSGTFHDIRRTCLSRWLENGLSEYDVMKLAGHSEFSTTQRFYLAVRTDLVDSARVASQARMSNDFGARLARASVNS